MCPRQILIPGILCVFLLFSVFPVFSETTSFNTIPVDQLSSGSPAVNNIIAQVLSGDCYSLSMALYSIEKLLLGTTYAGTENELLSILTHLCLCRECDQEGKASLNIRKKAIELIGRLGANSRYLNVTKKAETVLISLLDTEDDITAAASLIFALGMIGINTNGNAVHAIGTAIDRWNDTTTDNLFGLAVVASIERISSFNRKKQDWETYFTLIRIAQGNYDAMVRQKALDAINILGKQE